MDLRECAFFFLTHSQLPHPFLRKNSNSLSDSCFLFCEPALLGSWGVIPHTGPAGDFPEETERERKSLLRPVLTHSPKNDTNKPSLDQNATLVSSS